jgi:hypothetical protein
MIGDPPLHEPLFTLKEAAAKLNMSEKTAMAHVRAGRLRFINIANGKVRKRYRFTPKNLETFIQNQKVKEVPPCQSISVKAPHSIATTSNSTVVAFSALQKPKTKRMPKQ